MLARVKAPSRFWKAPTRSDAVGTMRNIAAKTKNGATPTQAATSGAGSRREGVGAALMGLMCAGFDPLPQGRSRARRKGVRQNARLYGEARAPSYFATVAPTTASHCLAMTSLAAFCSSSVGNFALA